MRSVYCHEFLYKRDEQIFCYFFHEKRQNCTRIVFVLNTLVIFLHNIHIIIVVEMYKMVEKEKPYII